MTHLAVAGALPRDARLLDVRTFAFAIGGDPTAERLARYDLVVVDGESASRRLINALHDRGVIVLGYLSVGTIEPGRSWYRQLKPYRLDHWDDWDEWFADTSSPKFRDEITGTIAPEILARGFDGLFLDNVDMIENHRAQSAGMEQLVTDLAELVHADGGLLFAQNGEAVITPMLPALDGWNREDVSMSYDFDRHRYAEQSAADVKHAQRALRRIAGAGLLVTATDYVAHGNDAGERRALRNACDVGAIPYIADIDLTRVPRTPWRCGDPG